MMNIDAPFRSVEKLIHAYNMGQLGTCHADPCCYREFFSSVFFLF